MKKSEFKQSRPVTAKLAGGELLKLKYLPRFMTSANIDAYNEFVKGKGERSEQEFFDVSLKFLASALDWIDLQDDNGKDMKVTHEGLKDFDLDTLTVNSIAEAIFNDLEKRANPTPPNEPESSTGSTVEEPSTPTT